MKKVYDFEGFKTDTSHEGLGNYDGESLEEFESTPIMMEGVEEAINGEDLWDMKENLEYEQEPPEYDKYRDGIIVEITEVDRLFNTKNPTENVYISENGDTLPLRIRKNHAFVFELLVEAKDVPNIDSLNFRQDVFLMEFIADKAPFFDQTKIERTADGYQLVCGVLIKDDWCLIEDIWPQIKYSALLLDLKLKEEIKEISSKIYSGGWPGSLN